MCQAIHRIYADAAPRHQRVVIHFPERKTGFQQTAETGVDTVFRYQTPIDCRFQLHVIPPIRIPSPSRWLLRKHWPWRHRDASRAGPG